MQCSGSTGGMDTCAAMTPNTANNQLTAIGSATPHYDAAGNMTNDGTGSHSYTWDAEGRMITVGSPAGTTVATYNYNALGQRVQASGSSIGSYPVFQYYDAFGNLGYHGDTVTWGYAPFPPVNGKVYGKYYGNTLFIHSNALGSTGTTTWQDGTWVSSEIYDPWGQRWATIGTLLDERFAGIDNVRDPESGLDQTPNRMLTSQYGRWLSPDPLAGSVTNPQSLNRYAYVLNNSINLTDPLGLVQYCPFGQTNNECNGPPVVIPAGPPPPDQPPYGPLPGTGPTGPGSSTPAPAGTHCCVGWARVLAGNPATIGLPGGLSGDTVGDFNVQAGSAAIALNQWPGVTKDTLRDVGMQISGSSYFHLPLDLTRPNTAVPFTFTGVTDIIGPPAAQKKLDKNFPKALLIELPSMPQSQDAGPALRAIKLTLPSNVPCPTGTSESKP